MLSDHARRFPEQESSSANIGSVGGDKDAELYAAALYQQQAELGLCEEPRMTYDELMLRKRQAEERGMPEVAAFYEAMAVRWYLEPEHAVVPRKAYGSSDRTTVFVEPLDKQGELLRRGSMAAERELASTVLDGPREGMRDRLETYLRKIALPLGQEIDPRDALSNHLFEQGFFGR